MKVAIGPSAWSKKSLKCLKLSGAPLAKCWVDAALGTCGSQWLPPSPVIRGRPGPPKRCNSATANKATTNAANAVDDMSGTAAAFLRTMSVELLFAAFVSPIVATTAVLMMMFAAAGPMWTNTVIAGAVALGRSVAAKEHET